MSMRTAASASADSQVMLGVIKPQKSSGAVARAAFLARTTLRAGCGGWGPPG
jgi:hypothetical protein